MNQCNENMPYIFISYSHLDSDLVLPIVNRLSAEGYNLWYDIGIEAGSEWDENIARHIGKCNYFIALVSENYISSKNCKDELNYSRDLDKEQFLIYLEDVELPAGMAMRMNRIQAIYWNKYEPDNVEAAYQKIFTAVGIERTRVLVPGMGTYQQAQSVLPDTNVSMNSAMNSCSKKREKASFFKPVLSVCGVLLIVLLTLAVVLGVVLIKKVINAGENAEVNTEVNTEVSIEVDSDHPLYEYYERAETGDVDAMMYLGDSYYNGSDYVAIDYEACLYWYEMAADTGNAEAMYKLGNCYYRGMYGVEYDPEMAFVWWHQAASRGHLDSIYNVAWCYEKGYGVQPDYDKAMEWNQILIDANYEF